jgi:hypothetical protein
MMKFRGIPIIVISPAVVGAVIIFISCMDTFAPMTATVLLITMIGAMVPTIFVAASAVSGVFFRLAVIYSLLFAYEFVTGAFIASLRVPMSFRQVLDQDLLAKAVGSALAGYILFLFGYGSLVFWRKIRPNKEFSVKDREEIVWSSRYKLGLLALFMLVTLLGLVQVFQRINYAGGINSFIWRVYQLRMGTFSETPEKNAFVVFANIVACSAIGLAGIGLIGWLRSKYTVFEKTVFALSMIILFVTQILTAFRAAIFFPVIALFAVYESERKLKWTKILLIALCFCLFLILINYAHQLMYYYTANWEYSGFVGTLSGLAAPQGHIQSLAQIIQTYESSNHTLMGRGLLESFCFFVPRFLWKSKAPSDEFGTIAVQKWARLPYWYQMAITNIGELIAHFGYLGALGMFVYGWLYCMLDSLRYKSLEMKCGLYCILMPRVLADIGMGFSALSISLVCLGVFALLCFLLRMISGNHLKPAGNSGVSQANA